MDIAVLTRSSDDSNKEKEKLNDLLPSDTYTHTGTSTAILHYTSTVQHPLLPAQHHLSSSSSSSSSSRSSSSGDQNQITAAPAAHKHLQICSATTSNSSSTGIELRRTLLLQQLLDNTTNTGETYRPSGLLTAESTEDAEGGEDSTRTPKHPSSASSSSSSSSSKARGSRGFGTSASSSSSRTNQQQQIAAHALCPCRSGLQYQYCCQPFLTAAAAPRSALELVSARLTAAKTGNAAYLVSTTHPDSSRALGGARDMTSRAKRVCAYFKANKMEIVGMAHCPGDLPGSWVVLTILQATAGEFVGQKTPYMEVLVRKNWTETAAAGQNKGLWDQDAAAAAAAAAGSSGESGRPGSSQSWMYLEHTNEFPQNGQADILIQLIQRHCPEVLIGSTDEQEEQQGIAEREVCFAWGAPNLHFNRCQQSMRVNNSSSSSGGGGVWYVDLLETAAKPLGSKGQQQQQESAAVSEEQYKQMLRQHRMLVPSGVFVMDEYLEQKKGARHQAG